MDEKIVIEVSGGCVSSVHASTKVREALIRLGVEIKLLDHDNAEDSDDPSDCISLVCIEPLEGADIDKKFLALI